MTIQIPRRTCVRHISFIAEGKTYIFYGSRKKIDEHFNLSLLPFVGGHSLLRRCLFFVALFRAELYNKLCNAERLMGSLKYCFLARHRFARKNISETCLAESKSSSVGNIEMRSRVFGIPPEQQEVELENNYASDPSDLSCHWKKI